MSARFGLGQHQLSQKSRLVVALVSGSHFLNHMFLVLLPPIFGLLATEFGASLAGLGLAVSVMSLSSTLAQIPFGYLSDNISRTVTLVVGLTVGAAGVFLVAIATSFPDLLAGQALLGVGIGAHHPAHYPLMSGATAEDNRAWAFSIHDTAGHLGYGAAPAFIVAVISLPGLTWRDAFLFVALISASYAVLALLVLSQMVSDAVTTGSQSNEGHKTRETSPSLRERALEQMRSLVRSPAVLMLTLLALMASMAGWGFRSFAVVLLTDGYGYGLATANTALTVMFVVSAVATLISGHLTDKLSATAIIVPAYVFTAFAAIAAGTLAVPALIAAVCLIVGASGHSMGNPPRNKLLDNLSNQGDLGVNFAIITVGVTLGGTIAPPLFGALIDSFGFWVAFYTIGGFGLVSAGLVGLIVRMYDMTSKITPIAGGND